MATQKAYLVGRHMSALGATEIEIVAQDSVTFPLTSAEVLPVLQDLEAKALAAGAEIILFKNTPGQVSVAMGKLLASGTKVRWGVVVSVPGKREAGVVKTFVFDPNSDLNNTQPDKVAEEAVKFANNRALTSTADGILTVTVDPVTPFVFSHIEWFNDQPVVESTETAAIAEPTPVGKVDIVTMYVDFQGAGQDEPYIELARRFNCRIVFVNGFWPTNVHFVFSKPFDGKAMSVDGHKPEDIKAALGQLM